MQNSTLKQILTILDDAQANDISVIDVHDQTTVTDYMVICSGRSSRHVSATAQQVADKMKQIKLPALSQTGLDTGEWALLDFGDVILHVMQPSSREFYNLEGLWKNNA